MGRTIEFTNEQIAKAIIKANGQIYVAAKYLKCQHSTIYSRFKNFPELRALAQSYKDLITDQVEQVLIKKALEAQEPWAVTFWLKTQAKHRGYTERTESSNLNIDFSKLTDEQLQRIANGEDIHIVIATTQSEG